MKTLTNRDIKQIQESAHDWMGFDLTDEQIIELAEKNPDWKADLIEFGGYDTVIREWLADILAKKLSRCGADYARGQLP